MTKDKSSSDGAFDKLYRNETSGGWFLVACGAMIFSVVALLSGSVFSTLYGSQAWFVSAFGAIVCIFASSKIIRRVKVSDLAAAADGSAADAKYLTNSPSKKSFITYDSERWNELAKSLDGRLLPDAETKSAVILVPLNDTFVSIFLHKVWADRDMESLYYLDTVVGLAYKKKSGFFFSLHRDGTPKYELKDNPSNHPDRLEELLSKIDLHQRLKKLPFNGAITFGTVNELEMEANAFGTYPPDVSILRLKLDHKNTYGQCHDWIYDPEVMRQCIAILSETLDALKELGLASPEPAEYEVG